MSVVSTIGYVAFLAGPPVLGFVGDRVGTLESLLVVAALLVPTVLLVSVAREPCARSRGPRGSRCGFAGSRGRALPTASQCLAKRRTSARS